AQPAPPPLPPLPTLTGVCFPPPPLMPAATPARFARRDVAPIALLGITQFGILIALLNYGLRFIPSARAALIFATLPLLTMVLAAGLGHERPTPAKIAGVLLTTVGGGLARGAQAGRRGGAGAGGW